MEETGGSCLARELPQDSGFDGFCEAPEVPEKVADSTEPALGTKSETQAQVDSSPSPALNFSENRSACEVPGDVDCGGRDQRANGLEGTKGRRQLRGKGSTVSTAWDALLDTFAQCYFTLRRDDRGCHALSPPLPERTVETATDRRNAIYAHGIPEAITFHREGAPLYLNSDTTKRNTHCFLPGAGEREKTRALIRSTAATAAVGGLDTPGSCVDVGCSSLALVGISEAINPHHLALCKETEGGALSRSLPSTSAAAEGANVLHQAISMYNTVTSGQGKLPRAISSEWWLMPLRHEDNSKRRKGVVTDAKVLDRLTRQMISDLQRQFAERNGVVSSTDFVYIFRKLFRRHESQAIAAAAPTGATAEPTWEGVSADENVDSTATTASEQEGQEQTHLLPGKVARKDGAPTSALANILHDPTERITQDCAGHELVDGTTENGVVVRQREVENESSLPGTTLDSVRPAKLGQDPLWQQIQQEKELLEVQQLLDVFGLVDVNDNDTVTWEQFTRFIIDKGRNEDFLKRMHLQRLEGREMKDTRLHLTPVESLTVAYDPPLSLDLVFYFEENSKTVEVLTPDHYPCSAPEQPAVDIPLQAGPLALPAFSDRECFSASSETATLSAASGRAAAEFGACAATAAKSTSYPLSSNQLPRDSIVQHRIPFVFPIRHSFTITAIAYCPSVQHLAVAAADLSLSFYNIRQAGVSGCRRSRPTGRAGNQSPVNAFSGVSLSAESTDRLNGGPLNGEEGSQWKATCSFKTRTSQIILYPSPGRPLLFSADHKGSIYAWDLLSICRAGSATSVTDEEPQRWHSPTEVRRIEQATCMRTVGNMNTFSSFPHAENSRPRRSTLSVSTEGSNDAYMPALRSRRKAMRFDADVTAPAPIDLGTLTFFNSSQQLSGKADGLSETPAISSSADAGGRDKGKARRAIAQVGSGFLPLGNSAVQRAVSSDNERGGASVPNVPPLRFPVNVQGGQEKTRTPANINDGNRPTPPRNKMSIRQRTEGSSTADRLGSSRTDHTSCDAPSSLTSSNGGRSLSSASKSTAIFYGKGRLQLHEYQSRRGRRHHSRLHVSNEALLRAHDVKAGVESPHWGAEDRSAPESTSRLSGRSVSTRGLTKCVSPCSSSPQKDLQRVNSQRQSQFGTQQQRQRDFLPCGTASEESMPVSPTSSSYTPSTVSAIAPMGSRNNVRSRFVVSAVVHKQLTRFNDFDSLMAVGSNSEGMRDEQEGTAGALPGIKSSVNAATPLRINHASDGANQVTPLCGTHQDTSTTSVCTDTVEDTQRSAESRNGPFARQRRDRVGRAGTKLPRAVQVESIDENDQCIARRSQGLYEADDEIVPEDPCRQCSNVSAHTARKSGVHGVDRPRVTGKCLEGSVWMERLRRQQQSLTAGEQTTCLSKDGRSGSSNRTTIGGLRPYTAFSGRLGAAQIVPAEPQSHLLRWRQLHAHSDIVSGFQELEGGTDMLASCGMDKRIILWSASTGEQKRVLDGHVRGIRALCFDIESRALLSGGFDYKLFVWNPYVGKKVHTIRGHSAPVVSICMLAGGGSSKRQFLSCDSEGIVKTWDLSSSACLQTLLAEDLLPASGGQLRALVALPHRQMLLAAAGRKLVALVYGAAPGNTSANSSSKQSSNPHSSQVQCRDTTSNGCGTAYNDTGRTKGAGENSGVTGEVGGKVVRNASSEEGAAGLQKVRTQISTGGGSSGGVAGGLSNWSGMGATKKRATIPALMGRRQDNGKFTGVADICKGLPREGEPLTKAVAHAGVRVLVTAGATHLRVWDLCTGVLISSITHDCSGCSNRVLRRRRNDASSMCTTGNKASSNNSSKVGTNYRNATQSRSSTGQRTNCSQSGGYGARGSRSSPDLKIKADTGLSGKAVMKEDGICRNKLMHKSEAEDAHVITDICLDRSGRKVFVADHFGCLCAYSVCTGQLVRRLTAHAAEISHLVYAPEDRNLISVSWDRSIIVHNDAPSSVGGTTAVSVSSGTGVIASSDRLTPHETAQSSQRRGSDGHMAALRRFLVTGDTVDGTAYNQTATANLLLSANRQTPVGENLIEGGGHNAAMVAPSADVLGYTGPGPPGFGSSRGRSNNSVLKHHGICVEEEREDETSKIWRRVDNAHLGDVTCCAYSRRLGLLATGGVDKAIFIWNYERLRRIACLFGHREDVAVLAFAEPLPFLCSADLSGTICIWVLPPHPHAVRVLEAQSVALSCYGKNPLSHLTTTEESPASTNGSRMSPVQLQTSTGAAANGRAHDGLYKQRDSSPTNGGILPTDRSTRNSQLIRNGPRGKLSTVDVIDNGKGQKSTSATRDVGNEASNITKSRAAATGAHGFQQLSKATTNCTVSVKATSPVTSQEKARVSALGGAYHTPPRSRPSSASVSFRLDTEQSIFVTGAAPIAGGTPKDFRGVTITEASEAKNTVSRENSNLRSLVPTVSADTAEEGAVPPTLLLVVIEDMEDITGTVPIVSLAALCRKRRNVKKRSLLASPSIPPRALPSPERPQEPEQQLALSAGGFSLLCLPATTRQAAGRAEEDLNQFQGYTKKSTTFLTSSDTGETGFCHNFSCANPSASVESPSSVRNTRGRACQTSGSEVSSSPGKLQRDPQQQNGTRRLSRKKSRSMNEVLLRLQQQQEEEAAAAAQDARWPQKAEFLLFAGDELGRVRVWDVSFLLQQLKGTRYIRKKTEWNPYRIWREELKESTLNIFRERVQQQQHQQQYLTRLVEEEEKAEDDMRGRGGDSSSEGGRPTSTGETTSNLRAGIRPVRVDGRTAPGEHPSEPDEFSLPLSKKRVQKKTHPAASAVKGDNCINISESASSGAEAPRPRRSHGSSTTKVVPMNNANNAISSSGPGSDVRAGQGQDDKPTKEEKFHMRGEERSSSTKTGSENETNSPGASLLASSKQQPGTTTGPRRPESSIVRRGVSFVEAQKETSQNDVTQLQQSESLNNDSRSSPTLRQHKRNVRASAELPEAPNGHRNEVNTTAEDGPLELEQLSPPVRAGVAGSISNSNSPSKASLDIWDLSGRALEADVEMRKRRERGTNYIGEDRGTRTGLEISNAFSKLLNGRETTPLFLRAPVRLIASWCAHRDGLKSMQLLPIRNQSARRICTPGSPSIAATGVPTPATMNTVTGEAAQDQMATAASLHCEGGRSNIPSESCFEKANKNTCGRKRLLLLTAGGDGAARLWDLSGITSDVTVPALFLDIATANTTRRNTNCIRSQFSAPTAVWPTFQGYEDLSQNAGTVTLASSVANAPMNSFGSATTCAAFLSRYGLPGSAAKTENSLLLHQQQLGKQPLPALPSAGSMSSQSQILLVGDLHAQSSNAVAAASGETHAARAAAAARGLQLQQPRRLWLLDLDEEEEIGNADSRGYTSSHAGEEEAYSSDGSVTEETDPSQLMRLAELHTRIKEMELEQEQLSARRADMRAEPSLLPFPLLPLPQDDGDLLSINDDNNNNSIPLALTDRRTSSSSTRSSSSSSAC